MAGGVVIKQLSNFRITIVNSTFMMMVEGILHNDSIKMCSSAVFLSHPLVVAVSICAYDPAQHSLYMLVYNIVY